MKCHYVYDKESMKKVLIPGCWSVVLSDNIKDCSCSDEDITYAQFERKKYNEEIEKRNIIIKELRSDVEYLKKNLDEYVSLLKKNKIKQK